MEYVQDAVSNDDYQDVIRQRNSIDRENIDLRLERHEKEQSLRVTREADRRNAELELISVRTQLGEKIAKLETQARVKPLAPFEVGTVDIYHTYQNGVFGGSPETHQSRMKQTEWDELCKNAGLALDSCGVAWKERWEACNVKYTDALAIVRAEVERVKGNLRNEREEHNNLRDGIRAVLRGK